MNGTSPRDDVRHALHSPRAKHAPIPPPPNATLDDPVSQVKKNSINLSSLQSQLLAAEQCQFLHY